MKKSLLGVLGLFLVSMSLNAQIWSEDFEGGIPEGWTAENQWRHGMTADIASQYFNPDQETNFMGVNDDALGNGVDGSGSLITSPIDLTGETDGLILRHSAYFINGDYQGADETAKVLVSEDGGATFAELVDIAGSQWGTVNANLSAYAGKTIVLAFQYQDGGGWNYGYCVDDIEIVSAGDPNISVEYFESYCQAGAVGTETAFYGTVTNNSLETLTSLDVTISNGTDEMTMTLTDLNIPSFASQPIFFDQGMELAEGTNSFTMTAANPNGMADDMSDNTQSVDAFGVVPVEGSGILVEEGTGTWCPWCPRGTYYMDRYSDCLPDNFVGVAVHNADPMVITEYDNGVGAFPGFTGYPGVIVNKTNVVDPSEIGNPTITAITAEPMARVAVGAEWDEDSRTLTASVAGSDFVQDMNGVKFFATLTENGVTGTGTDYNQANNYAGGTVGPMGGFEFLPGSIPASDIEYNHTARALLGGFFGTNPMDMSAGDTGGYIFSSVQIPPDQDIDEMYIVGALINANNQVINVVQSTVADAVAAGLFNSSSNDIYDNTLAQVFPNPTKDVAFIQLDVDAASEVTLEVYDMLGQLVNTVQYGTVVGNTTLDYDTSDLTNGMYNLHLQVGEVFVSKKITVAK